MRVALANGFIGVCLSFLVGIRVLEWTVKETALCLLASFIAGLFGMITTLSAERNFWIKNHLLRGAGPTWGLMVLLYFGIFLAFVPQVRNLETLAWIFFPLMLAHGWTIIAFGPIQDWVIRRYQRKLRSAT